MKIQHHNLLLPRLFFGSPVFANNMSKDWIGLLPTRQQAPTFCVPLPHAPRLCRLLKVPLHGQCAHWKKLHVSQENTYPAVSASEIATSQAALCTVQLRAQKSPFFDGKRHLFSCPTPHYSAPTPQLRPKKSTFFRGKTPFLKHATE